MTGHSGLRVGTGGVVDEFRISRCCPSGTLCRARSGLVPTVWRGSALRHKGSQAGGRSPANRILSTSGLLTSTSSWARRGVRKLMHLAALGAVKSHAVPDATNGGDPSRVIRERLGR